MPPLPIQMRQPEIGWAERTAFRTWFARVWEQQVGLPLDGHLRQFPDEALFMTALAACMRKHDVEGGAPDPRTLNNWRKGSSVPRETYVDPLLDALLGHGPDGKPERERGWALWRAAEIAKNRSSTEKRRPSPIVDETPGESDWKAENAEPLQQGLAELLVHPPARGGNTPLEFPLRISLSFAECPDEIEDATLALTEATLIPTYTNCRPTPGSRLGEGDTPHEHLLFRGGVWRINGPRLANDHLQGEPLVSEALCTLQCDGEDDDSLALTLRSGKRALVVFPDQPDTDPSVVKQRVLQALLQKLAPSDREGMVTWGRTSLKRKPPK